MVCCILYAMEEKLKQEFTMELRKLWLVVLGRMVESMIKGLKAGPSFEERVSALLHGTNWDILRLLQRKGRDAESPQDASCPKDDSSDSPHDLRKGTDLSQETKEPSQCVHEDAGPSLDTASAAESPRDTSNAPEPPWDTASVPGSSQDTANAPEPPRDAASVSGSSRDTANAPAPPRDTANSPGSSRDTQNAPEPPRDTANTPRSSQVTPNAPEPPRDTANTPGSLRDTANTPGSLQDTANTPGSMRDTANTPGSLRDTANTPGTILRRCLCVATSRDNSDASRLRNDAQK
ncbi:hypothetical protein BaRGS_00018582 [Batillaria attramentaria]|uniref:Uncharacterized protein n=1 Tax=Batillaria attramentaria TaxID=370345 RepID=A0ABD0KSW8_9CAEN